MTVRKWLHNRVCVYLFAWLTYFSIILLVFFPVSAADRSVGTDQAILDSETITFYGKIISAPPCRGLPSCIRTRNEITISVPIEGGEFSGSGFHSWSAIFTDGCPATTIEQDFSITGSFNPETFRLSGVVTYNSTVPFYVSDECVLKVQTTTNTAELEGTLVENKITGSITTEGSVGKFELTTDQAFPTETDPEPEAEEQPIPPISSEVSPVASPESSAGFDVTIGCNQKVKDTETIDCTINIFADEELADAIFSVNWSVDGITAKTSGGITDSDSLSISPLPPGYHQVSVIVSSPNTSHSSSAATVTEVIESGEESDSATSADSASASSEMVHPAGQAAAALGTTAALAAWLWLEYQNSSQGYENLQSHLEGQVAQEDADRQEWYNAQSDLNQANTAQHLQNQNYVYDAENDVWRPGPGHPEYDEAIIRQHIDHAAGTVRTLIQDMPPTQQAAIGELIDNFQYGDLNGLEALQNLATIRYGATLQIEGASEMEHAEIDMDMAWIGLAEDATSNVQMGAAAAGLFAIGGTWLVNPAALAQISGELASIGLVGNVTSGALGGYAEGGLQIAIIRVGQNTLPVNAVGSLVDPNASWTDVGLSAIRDLGNTFTTIEGSNYIYQHVGPAAGQASQNLINALHNPSLSTSDDVLAVGQSTVDDVVRAGQTSVDDALVAGDDLAGVGQSSVDDGIAVGQSSADDAVADGDDLAAAVESTADDAVSSSQSATDDVSTAADDLTPEQQALNEAAVRDQQIGQDKIDRFEALCDEYNNPATSGARRNELEAQLNQAANEINADYQATNIMKYDADPELQQAFTTEIGRTHNNVDQEFVDQLNQQGIRIGDRNVNVDDFYDIRNQSSGTTPGIDRDLGFDQRFEQTIREQLNNVAAGSDEAHQLQEQLSNIKQQSQVTLNGQPISNAEANQIFQQTYNQSFATVTGTSADDALQTVTFDHHVEAYADINAIKNDPVSFPFQQNQASQTASVNIAKADQIKNMVRDGGMAAHNGIQETCRSTWKEMQTKIDKLVRNDPNIKPETIERLKEIEHLLGRAGRGEMRPGTALNQIQTKFGTDLDGIVKEIGANFEFLIKNQ